VLIGLPSSGPHSNGYSLVRKIIEVSKAKLSQKLGSGTLEDALLAPTEIYVKPILKLIDDGIEMKGGSHITGGGIVGNLPRCFPKGVAAVVDTTSWTRPAVFDWLQEKGNVTQEEMWRVFNCGVGFIAIVPRKQVAAALASLKKSKVKAFEIGEIVKGKGDVRFV